MAQRVVVKNPYGDVQFRQLSKVPSVDGTFCFGGKRYVVHGVGVVDFVFESWKWPNQLAFNVWSRKLPEIETRPFQDNYTRSAIAYDRKQAIEVLAGLLSHALDEGTAWDLASRVIRSIWGLQ